MAKYSVFCQTYVRWNLYALIAVHRMSRKYSVWLRKRSDHLPVRLAVEGHAQKSAWVSAGWLGWWCWLGTPSPLAAASSCPRSEPRPTTQDSIVTSVLKIEAACPRLSTFETAMKSTVHLNHRLVFVLTVPLCSQWRTCAAGAMLPTSVCGSPSAPGGRPTTRSGRPSTQRWWLRPSGRSLSSRSPFCSPAPCAAGQCCWFLWQTWWISPGAPGTHINNTTLQGLDTRTFCYNAVK